MFAGDGKVSASEWMDTLTIYFEAAGLSLVDERKKLSIASTLLRGRALDWYRVVRSSGAINFSQFRERLIAYFDPVDREEVAREKLYTLTHTAGPLLSHIQTFQRLNMMVQDMSNSDRLALFLRGLKPKLRGQVFMQDPVDLEGAIEIALTVERALAKGLDVSQSRNTTEKRGGGDPMDIGSFKKNNQNPHAHLRCNQCKKLGHIKINCPLLSKNSRGRSSKTG